MVCATGYAAADYLGQIDVAGEGGVTLRETWRDGAYAYLGMAVPGFPNFFMLYGPNTNVGSNSVIFMLEAQARYIVRALKYLRRKRKSYVAVRAAAMADFLAKIDQWMQGTVWTHPVQQLLPRRQRAGGDAVAAQCASVLGDDPAFQATDLHFRTADAEVRRSRRRRRLPAADGHVHDDSTPRCGSSRPHAPTCRRASSVSSVIH